MEKSSIYLTDNIKDQNVDSLLSLARSKSMPYGYFVIVVGIKDEELLVMYSSSGVNKDRFVESNYHIVGFGKGKRQTRKLIVKIFDDMMEKKGEITKENLMAIGN